MALLNRTDQTGDMSGGPMDYTTITYYTVSEADDMLAVARYTAYGVDKLPIAICEDFYQDTPDEFCRLEEDVETALVAGIDVSVMSHYESTVFPVISDYLTL
tara:strand:- start:79 stop:384 length:306 start_codon:yes stop_codon:yes gene_type:complete